MGEGSSYSVCSSISQEGEYTKNPSYGQLKCFHCLLSPAGDDPIFIGINRLVAKGLGSSPPEYPCRIVNKFQYSYETNNVQDKQFDVDDLFRLQHMAFAVEISLAKARKEDSKVQIKNKEELLYALTDREALYKILDQGEEALLE